MRTAVTLAWRNAPPTLLVILLLPSLSTAADSDTGFNRAMDHERDMRQMDMSSMQGGSAPASARDPDYSDGVGYGDLDPHMADNEWFSMLLVDKLEYTSGSGDDAAALDAQAWLGKDLDKLWFKADGDHADNQLQDLRLEALWNHAIAPYWGAQLGVRQDLGIGPQRSWLAFGVQGLSSYYFDIQATAYVGPGGRTAARFEAESDLLLTQRLIISPDFEINLYGKSDPDRGLGEGLADSDLGVRLRYEIRREFAPYIGISWTQLYGSTAELARTAGKPVSQTKVVIGLRAWF